MWVNGKYIVKTHPLHKPGRYKTFEDAAFSSLERYELSKEGQVYVITNPNFPEWVKVGMAVDAEDRLNNYQTSSPFRDYTLVSAWSVTDRRTAEAEAEECWDEADWNSHEGLSAREIKDARDEEMEFLHKRKIWVGDGLQRLRVIPELGWPHNGNDFLLIWVLLFIFVFSEISL